MKTSMVKGSVLLCRFWFYSEALPSFIRGFHHPLFGGSTILYSGVPPSFIRGFHHPLFGGSTILYSGVPLLKDGYYSISFCSQVLKEKRDKQPTTEFDGAESSDSDTSNTTASEPARGRGRGRGSRGGRGSTRARGGGRRGRGRATVPSSPAATQLQLADNIAAAPSTARVSCIASFPGLLSHFLLQ